MRMIYRVKQFISSMTAKITEEDRAFYKKYLTLKESVLFERLKVYDQKHSLHVAYLLKEKTDGNEEMIRLGLLHDIGKQVYPLNPFQKGIMVILDKMSKGSVKKYDQIKMIYSYYEHPMIGYEILKQEGGYEESFLQLIKSHHIKGNMNINIDDRLLNLQEADDQA